MITIPFQQFVSPPASLNLFTTFSVDLRRYFRDTPPSFAVLLPWYWKYLYRYNSEVMKRFEYTFPPIPLFYVCSSPVWPFTPAFSRILDEYQSRFIFLVTFHSYFHAITLYNNLTRFMIIQIQLDAESLWWQPAKYCWWGVNLNDSCICFSLFRCSLILIDFGKPRHGLFIKEGRDEVEWKPKEISRSFSE